MKVEERGRRRNGPDKIGAQLDAQRLGLSVVGEGGLLAQLTLVLESALEGEMTAHLGYDKHEPSASTSL